MINIITRNKNDIKEHCHNNCSKNIKVMRDTNERGGTKAIPSHALDTIKNPSEACLPLDLA